MKKLEKILKALANGRRLAIVGFLKSRREASVGEIAEKIGLSIKSTSKHLTILRAADIVDSRQVSLTVFYRLSPNIPAPAKSVLSHL